MAWTVKLSPPCILISLLLTKVLYICVSSGLLAHDSRDLSQAKTNITLFQSWTNSQNDNYSYSTVRNKRRTYVYYFLIFFPGSTALLKALRLLNFGFFSMAYRYFQVLWVFCNITSRISFMPYVYLRPYVYSFWQIFKALRLFPALRLLRTLEYMSRKSKSLLAMMYFQIHGFA